MKKRNGKKNFNGEPLSPVNQEVNNFTHVEEAIRELA